MSSGVQHPLRFLPKSSETFNAHDADVTFESCDHILFHVHRKNLETHATGFAPPEMDTHGEAVPVTEESGTLELLFAFMYPRIQPDLESLRFKVLAPLAEAAEKYQVFAAMSLCKIWMKKFLPTHAQDILMYSVKHGYGDIANQAAQALLDVPLSTTVSTLPTHLVIPWIRYYEHWREKVPTAFSPWGMVIGLPSGPDEDDIEPHECEDCEVCGGDLDRAMLRMMRALPGQAELPKTLRSKAWMGFERSGHISSSDFIARLEGILDSIPKFITYI